MESYSVLLLSTATIAFLHALAPDHWMPFAMIAKAQRWSNRKLSIVTFLCGLGHVGSSILIGAVGLMLGFSLTQVHGTESSRGEVALLLLIGFGAAYALWGLKHAREHHHMEVDNRKTVTFWALFTIFVFGPCEPLIPLMFLAVQFGWYGILSVGMVFSAITISMMEVQSVLAYSGAKLFWPHSIERYSHAMAGAVIAFTGVFVWVMGI
ncbi:MAG: hypothetical protein V1921_05995 [Candidatus Altiarchaeota archaeon]